MSNFLDDYIAFKKEENVIRTQYGILDKVTGEHLVPVKRAQEYFGEDMVEIEGKPNSGTPVAKEPTEPTEPTDPTSPTDPTDPTDPPVEPEE